MVASLPRKTGTASRQVKNNVGMGFFCLPIKCYHVAVTGNLNDGWRLNSFITAMFT